LWFANALKPSHLPRRHPHENKTMPKRILKVVLTGGPCAGKTSALAYLQKRLTALGVRVILVPEAATITILGGAGPKYIGGPRFQKNLIKLQTALEDHFEDLAKDFPEETAVLILDRGKLDGKAFCSPEQWDYVLKELETTEEALVRNYAVVVHMVTAADGAKEHYTLANNKARSETPEEAVESDKKLQNAWLCSKLRVVSNNVECFDKKIERVGHEILHAIGLPEPYEEEVRFALKPNALEKLKAHVTDYVALEISQTYLYSPPGESRRVRERNYKGESTYFHCRKRHIAPGKNIEQEEIIGQAEYLALLSQANPERKTIKKTRYCFLHEGKLLELDVYHDPKLDFVTLEIETENFQTKPPKFFGEYVDILGIKSLSNEGIAAAAAANKEIQNPFLPKEKTHAHAPIL
jgi:CYTH domain-containing protein